MEKNRGSGQFSEFANNSEMGVITRKVAGLVETRSLCQQAERTSRDIFTF